MKRFTFLLLLMATGALAQQEPLKKSQLIAPKELAAKVNNAPSSKPIIYNIGPMQAIKTSQKIGAVNTDEGLAKLKNASAKIPKEKEIVLYCGCCSSQNCPNIRPALTLLTKEGFKNVKVLDIPVGLNEDWITKGYPME